MTTITKTQNGYEMNENGAVTILTEITKDGKSLILPENESGRKFMALSKLEKNPTLELTSIIRNPSAEPRQGGKKNPNLADLREYMQEGDWEIIQNVIEAAKKAYAEAHEKKPLTEKEKLQKKLEALQKKLEALNESDGD